jgi:ABC-2 type transport system ATP-binding protein
MRCEIAASLLHNPELLFLDEPTIGLDAVSKQVVRDFIKKLNKEKNTTVILTSHDMADITTLAKRIILIGKGKVLYDGNLQKLKNNYIKEKTINIETNDKINTKKKGIKKVTKTKNGYELVINQDEITINQFINYITDKITISNIDIEEDNIDNLIVKLYQDYNI